MKIVRLLSLLLLSILMFTVGDVQASGCTFTMCSISEYIGCPTRPRTNSPTYMVNLLDALLAYKFTAINQQLKAEPHCAL